MTIRVVFVCTGNLCRSPMAEAMLRHALDAMGCTGVEVSSTGTWADADQPATPVAVATLKARGIDLARHRSRRLERSEIENADLVLGMTSVHEREVLAVAPRAAERFRLIKELPELDLRVDDAATPGSRLAALLDAPRPPARRSLDVDDPMGLPSSAYERAYGEIDRALEVLVEVLCGDPARG